MNLGALLFSYNGRINRGKYWLAALCYFIGFLILIALFFIPVIGVVIGVIGYIAIIVSSVMVGIKRLHDRNKSGWWIAFFIGVPFVLGGLGYVLASGDAGGGALGLVFSVLNLVVAVWMIVELGCLRGTVGPNEYGADPLPSATV